MCCISMEITESIIFAVELIGTVAFAISGAMVAIDHDLDVFGVLFMAVIVALGGGTLRDILLGNLPPKMFSNYTFVAVAAAAGLLVFLLASAGRRFYVRHAGHLDKINNLFDALGLAAFTASGVQMAILSGFGDNGFLCVVMGMTTAVGGGIIRDVCVHDIPMVFCKNVYAVASILGAIVYYGMYRLHVAAPWCSFACMAVTLAVRIVAIVFKLNLPHASIADKMGHLPGSRL